MGLGDSERWEGQHWAMLVFPVGALLFRWGIAEWRAPLSALIGSSMQKGLLAGMLSFRPFEQSRKHEGSVERDD